LWNMFKAMECNKNLEPHEVFGVTMFVWLLLLLF
jgi:hypothetical protein